MGSMANRWVIGRVVPEVYVRRRACKVKRRTTAVSRKALHRTERHRRRIRHQFWPENRVPKTTRLLYRRLGQPRTHARATSRNTSLELVKHKAFAKTIVDHNKDQIRRSGRISTKLRGKKKKVSMWHFKEPLRMDRRLPNHLVVADLHERRLLLQVNKLACLINQMHSPQIKDLDEPVCLPEARVFHPNLKPIFRRACKTQCLI